MVTRAALKLLKGALPGRRVRLLANLSDPYTKLGVGDVGTVAHVDDAGTVFVDWDSGSNLGLILGKDEFALIEDVGRPRPAASETSD
ncbi:MAG: DUF4314 domain-containing protein [Actinomycetia bacterium]|nr:DUF4314 domain-containing protein [Actinomycetes bacterium]MCP4845045.1 DUF4314 domain-containing protein [Actinomycetes bacterium]